MNAKLTTLKSYWLLFCLSLTSLLAGCHYVVQEPAIDIVNQSDLSCELITQFRWGDGEGELGYIPEGQVSSVPYVPYRFQVDEKGNIYVADLHNARVVIFHPDGTLFDTLDLPKSQDKEYIVDIAVRDETLAVATTNNIYVLNPEHRALQLLEWPVDMGPYVFCSKDAAGRKVQVDEIGNVYTCNKKEDDPIERIVQFDLEGVGHTFFADNFDHFIVGEDGFVYIEQVGLSGTIESPPDSQILKLNLQGNQVSKLLIYGQDLGKAGLIYPGLLVAVDAKSNLYSNATNIIRDGQLVSQELIIQFNPQGKISRFIEQDKFTRPATNVIDREGYLYVWGSSSNTLSEPIEIWRCAP